MSIRIGNTVYIDGMLPIECEPAFAADIERIAAQFEVTKETLRDLQVNEPGGIIRVGRRLS